MGGTRKRDWRWRERLYPFWRPPVVWLRCSKVPAHPNHWPVLSPLQARDSLAASSSSQPDTLSAEIAPYEAMGFSTQDVLIARAAVGGAGSGPEAVQQACRSVVELRSMGFAPAVILGALKLHRCDVAAATEACLAASTTQS